MFSHRGTPIPYLLGAIALLSGPPAFAQTQGLRVVYPTDGYSTGADRIFILGSAPPGQTVTVNGQGIRRSPQGNFAPSFPLQLGSNRFTVTAGGQTLTLNVTRQGINPQDFTSFIPGTLGPAQPIRRLPNEAICFQASAPPHSAIAVTLGSQTINLLPQHKNQLTGNGAVLTQSNDSLAQTLPLYGGCGRFNTPGDLGSPRFTLTHGGKQTSEITAPVTILDPDRLEVIRVITDQAITRTGPTSDYSRLTPLPKGTEASVTGQEGDWLRLDYGAWINRKDTESLPPNTLPPRTLVRGINGSLTDEGTVINFPLETPVPMAIQQGDRSIDLTLYNATAQTDTVYLPQSPILDRLDWQQSQPGQIVYHLSLKTAPWGYLTRYHGSNFQLILRHPPQIRGDRPLRGLRILLDPGHGGTEKGALGLDGTPEKAVNLAISLQLKTFLEQRGATVILTRNDDRDVSLGDRVQQIQNSQPTIALSLHHNALPDQGDAEKTRGIAAFWYHPQSHPLAQFLHDQLVRRLQRPSYGVYWGNLALTRPTAAPAVLLELGFMTNPWEYEAVSDPQEQTRVARAIADSLAAWFAQSPP